MTRETRDLAWAGCAILVVSAVVMIGVLAEAVKLIVGL